MIMKLHSEISISRLVLYFAFLTSLPGGSFSGKSESNSDELSAPKIDSTKDDSSLRKNLHGTSVGDRLVCWDKYGPDNN
jgi:hypothetical protein